MPYNLRLIVVIKAHCDAYTVPYQASARLHIPNTSIPLDSLLPRTPPSSAAASTLGRRIRNMGAVSADYAHVVELSSKRGKGKGGLDDGFDKGRFNWRACGRLIMNE
ncbi:hypothetical protein JR316_0005511 [Psilocybe cubensis]|uniref:Uncharacterized protein n=1 Tax=Psilocybe cubensis TaxID=181762 RepID=A0ACB8GZ04_PSICU|nr:hypothetical protein JR316_0005511 [Psilocybe cubensis]KAH9480993.1 hypothetical protein JR316_0005511 [Psilocybe cubensis]